MRRRKNNLIEVRRVKPVRNNAVYRSIVPKNLTSTSAFSNDPIVIDELVSITSIEKIVKKPVKPSKPDSAVKK